MTACATSDQRHFSSHHFLLDKNYSYVLAQWGCSQPKAINTLHIYLCSTNLWSCFMYPHMFVGVWNSICCIIVKKNNKWKDKCLQSSADLSLNELLKESGKLVIQTDLVVCPSAFWKTNTNFFFFSAFFFVPLKLSQIHSEVICNQAVLNQPENKFTFTLLHIYTSTHLHICAHSIKWNNH